MSTFESKNSAATRFVAVAWPGPRCRDILGDICQEKKNINVMSCRDICLKNKDIFRVQGRDISLLIAERLVRRQTRARAVTNDNHYRAFISAKFRLSPNATLPDLATQIKLKWKPPPRCGDPSILDILSHGGSRAGIGKSPASRHGEPTHRIPHARAAACFASRGKRAPGHRVSGSTGQDDWPGARVEQSASHRVNLSSKHT